MDKTQLPISGPRNLFMEDAPAVPKPIPTWLAIIRWIGFFPCAVVGGSLAALAFRAVNYLTMVWYLGMSENGIQMLVVKHVVANLILGAGIVYIGAKIAPYHTRVVTYGLALVTILLGGLGLYPAIVEQDWWAVVGAVVMAIGAGVVALSVASGELDIDTHKFGE
jgi:hypothetical protein